MTNREVASLLVGFDEARRARLDGAMDQRRRDLVAEELERLGALGRRQQDQLHKDAKNKVLLLLRRLKTEGMIDEALNAANQTEQAGARRQPRRAPTPISGGLHNGSWRGARCIS